MDNVTIIHETDGLMFHNSINIKTDLIYKNDTDIESSQVLFPGFNIWSNTITTNF